MSKYDNFMGGGGKKKKKGGTDVRARLLGSDDDDPSKASGTGEASGGYGYGAAASDDEEYDIEQGGGSNNSEKAGAVLEKCQEIRQEICGASNNRAALTVMAKCTDAITRATKMLENSTVRMREDISGGEKEKIWAALSAEWGTNVERLVQSAKKSLQIAKTKMQAMIRLRQQNEAELRGGMIVAVNRLITDTQNQFALRLKELMAAEDAFDKVMKDGVGHKLKGIYPDATDAQVREAMENPAVFQGMIAEHQQKQAHRKVGDQERNAQKQELEALLARNTCLVNIEKNVKEMAELLAQLALLAEAQGQMLDSIEDDVDKVQAQTASAQQELTKAAEHKDSYEKKLFWLIIFIGGIFFLLFAVLIVGMLTR